MRVKNTKIKLTIPIPINEPDNNGVVYTKEAIEKAINNMNSHLPILYKDNETDEKVIGMTGESHTAFWDPENQICRLEIDGSIFYSGAEIIVNEIENGKVTDFKFVNIGLTI